MALLDEADLLLLTHAWLDDDLAGIDVVALRAAVSLQEDALVSDLLRATVEELLERAIDSDTQFTEFLEEGQTKLLCESLLNH